MPPAKESDAELYNANGMYSWGFGQFCVPRHPSKTINLVFADSSARKVKLADLWRLKWYKQFDTGNMYANGTRKLPSWITK